MAISASGIHQKDPHVSGVTNRSWAENEARATVSGGKKKPPRRVLYMMGEGGSSALRYVARVHIRQEKTTTPMGKPNDWKKEGS
jgi:hypothetical protein